MNVFISDLSAIKSAQNLDDKRIRHMSKEAFEMISMAIYKNTGQCVAPFIIWNRENRTKDFKFDELFNNRCTNWVASKRENIWWLWCHARALHKEYEFRFGQTHYLEEAFVAISHWVPEAKEQPKSFCDASGQTSSNIILNYQKCLNIKWFITDEIKPVLWTKRGNPSWIDYSVDFGIEHSAKINPNNYELFPILKEELESNEDDLPF